MKFWQACSFTETEQLLEIARGAEAAGFDGVLVSEHVFIPEKIAPKYPYAADGVPGFDGATPFPEPWSAISAMAAVTKRLRFATMIYILPLHHPLEVAKATATAAVLSGDRVILGAGAGWMREEYDVLGVPFEKRGQRFDEAIEVLRKVWRGETVEHHGRHFDFPRIRSSPPPPSRRIPIWIGGVSAAALRRVARLGDGWLGSGHTPEQATELLREIARLRKQAGREDESFETVVPLVTPPDHDVLRRLFDEGAHGTVSYPFSYSVGPGATLEQKLDVMKRYGDQVIGPMNRC